MLGGCASGSVLASTEALSFWGGVDPADGRVIDVHHPWHGRCIGGQVLAMPSSRGSCSGSGVLLDLALNGRAPAALVFSGAEDVLTLGALVAAEMFGLSLPVLRLPPEAFDILARSSHCEITETMLCADGIEIPIGPAVDAALDLSAGDRAMLGDDAAPAVRQAMRIVCAMAAQQGAERLIDVTQVHIDGCIYASPANLAFAETLERMGGRVTLPTTMNAISVDRENWREQGVPPAFGDPAARLADAYVRMGCRPTFTCAPYLLDGAPEPGERIAWSESNAVIFANSVLGARTVKHPDFLDLCIAITGRAPLSGVYGNAERRACCGIDVELPDGAGDAIWPLIGYLAGHASPDGIPLLRGLSQGRPTRDDLKALCAAFGTSSAAPMLHIEGVTPEAAGSLGPDAPIRAITRAALAEAYARLNAGPADVDLVAIGSPHASLSECRALADALSGRIRHADVDVIVTAGRHVIAQALAEGTLERLSASGVSVLPDLCWCSISEPVFPARARTVLTNSGKYAHYGPGLSGRTVRFGTLADCVEAATTGRAPPRLPDWLA
ncbi:hypothetical protein ASG43_04905 [Aureimonas sp. Leaf454]|uniref:cis-3-hydroxy-L-proline dehydratase n=1 Tax=Aureimonas sp. Leaf454 TaxID=1736381 RepID=UPI0007001947|nr:aconitase X [Aureimonas sp. Leaf454]KQT55023.1 hypothetical protein ASG43_04905 [Aureimonas sp. Leaf454]